MGDSQAVKSHEYEVLARSPKQCSRWIAGQRPRYGALRRLEVRENGSLDMESSHLRLQDISKTAIPSMLLNMETEQAWWCCLVVLISAYPCCGC